MQQLYELSRKFPESLVQQKPGDKFQADYVSHSTISERLLVVLGPYSFTVDKPVTNSDGVVVGCLATLRCVIDGREVVITEVGDVDRPGQNNGANLKNAASDAIKRCAMRTGLGLHLWSQKDYFLEASMKKKIDDAVEAEKDE
jgi:hypothetical protein